MVLSLKGNHTLSDDCNVQWSRYHIFIECPFLEQFRACLHRKYGPNLTMNSILDKPPLGGSDLIFFQFCLFSDHLICCINYGLYILFLVCFVTDFSWVSFVTGMARRPWNQLNNNNRYENCSRNFSIWFNSGEFQSWISNGPFSAQLICKKVTFLCFSIDLFWVSFGTTPAILLWI